MKLSSSQKLRSSRVLIRRRNPAARETGRTVGRTDRQIFYGRTGPDRRPLYNFDQRSLVSLSVTVGIKVDIHGYHICLWFSNVFWKKTKYPPRTVCKNFVIFSNFWRGKKAWFFSAFLLFILQGGKGGMSFFHFFLLLNWGSGCELYFFIFCYFL